MSAKEFRDIFWSKNPKVIHIPSVYQIGLMEAYAKYYYHIRMSAVKAALLSSNTRTLMEVTSLRSTAGAPPPRVSITLEPESDRLWLPCHAIEVAVTESTSGAIPDAPASSGMLRSSRAARSSPTESSP